MRNSALNGLVPVTALAGWGLIRASRIFRFALFTHDCLVEMGCGDVVVIAGTLSGDHEVRAVERQRADIGIRFAMAAPAIHLEMFTFGYWIIRHRWMLSQSGCSRQNFRDGSDGAS
ncbi:MAG TPA: hypothetical protein VNM92_04785 [Thermoanaerobaculia bacterium]|nr:hypothetical protein [Thermoanaerobaculia bacterium]